MKSKLRKALFIDIDGVIIYDPGHLSEPDEVEFLRGTIHSLKEAWDYGYLLIFISNKGGSVSKKGLTFKGLAKIDDLFSKTLIKSGLTAESFSTYYCTHYPPEICQCRKPLPGLYEEAVEGHRIDTKNSFVIGDKESDLIPGISIGCKLGILVKRNQKDFDANPESENKYLHLNNLSEAVKYILNLNDK